VSLAEKEANKYQIHQRYWCHRRKKNRKTKNRKKKILGTGVTVGKKIADNGKLMVISCVLYMIIQVPVILKPESSYKAKNAKELFEEECDTVALVRTPKSCSKRSATPWLW
jgi:hypothetical protein